MKLQDTMSRFGELLHTRLDKNIFTTEDSVRYTFFAALMEKGKISCEQVILEYPHPSIPRAKIDTWISDLDGNRWAIEFKYDRDIPSQKNTPRTQKAGMVFHDLGRLAKIGVNVRGIFVYLTGPEMAGYFSNLSNGLAQFFALPVGASMKIDSNFINGKAATFLAAAGELPDVVIESLHSRNLSAQHELRIYEIKIT